MRHRTPSRGIAALLSLALVLGLGAVATVASGVVTAAPAQAATGTLSLGHGATPASVLAGEDATIALRAEHTGAAADIAYNLTFVATLPPGATYVAGSATPASGPGAPGEPTAQQVVPNPADPSSSYWVLVWSNVTDRPPGAWRPSASISTWTRRASPRAAPSSSRAASWAAPTSASSPR